jgi:hypothetical protein
VNVHRCSRLLVVALAASIDLVVLGAVAAVIGSWPEPEQETMTREEIEAEIDA